MQIHCGVRAQHALRRFCGMAALAASALAITGCGGGDGVEIVRQATWVSAPVDAYKPQFPGIPTVPQVALENQTVRHIVRTSAGGDGVRVRVSNLFGVQALKLGPLHVARSLGAGRVDTATNVALTFNGSTSVTVAPGQEAWSDVVSMAVPGGADLAVSFFVPEKALPQTLHASSNRPFFWAAGNVTTQAELAPAPSMPAWSPTLWITGIDVQNTTARGVVVAIGDSITEGSGSTFNALASYPDYLARRVAADSQLAGYSVVNAGIGGNRLLGDDVVAAFGERLINRFDRDALKVTGASHVIVLIGINDIGIGAQSPRLARSAAELQAGLKTLVEQARAAHIKIFLGTVPPFEGASYYSTEGEAKRQALNTWIRGNSAQATGIVDFDAATRDPALPTRLLALYDSGDQLHPSDKGYEAMSRAVDLAMLR